MCLNTNDEKTVTEQGSRSSGWLAAVQQQSPDTLLSKLNKYIEKLTSPCWG